MMEVLNYGIQKLQNIKWEKNIFLVLLEINKGSKITTTSYGVLWPRQE